MTKTKEARKLPPERKKKKTGGKGDMGTERTV